MFFGQDRIEQEKRTVEAMIRLHCRDQHGGRDELCADCADLLEYAWVRLDRCPFQEGKTTCAKCPVHCYKPDMREKVRTVMRYAGPRMLLRHPMLALLHLVHGRRQKPLGREEEGSSR
jgi:predicted amidophosphoribosyltransferase